MLCRDCKYMKEINVTRITARYYCNISPGKQGNKLGVHPWINKEHSKCPHKQQEKKENEQCKK